MAVFISPKNYFCQFSDSYVSVLHRCLHRCSSSSFLTHFIYCKSTDTNVISLVCTYIPLLTFRTDIFLRSLACSVLHRKPSHCEHYPPLSIITSVRPRVLLRLKQHWHHYTYMYTSVVYWILLKGLKLCYAYQDTLVGGGRYLIQLSVSETTKRLIFDWVIDCRGFRRRWFCTFAEFA
jgi:hypothetical protein